jgi:hypothetical protein
MEIPINTALFILAIEGVPPAADCTTWPRLRRFSICHGYAIPQVMSLSPRAFVPFLVSVAIQGFPLTTLPYKILIVWNRVLERRLCIRPSFMEIFLGSSVYPNGQGSPSPQVRSVWSTELGVKLRLARTFQGAEDVRDVSCLAESSARWCTKHT